MNDDHVLIDLARARIVELLRADIEAGDSPFVAINPGPRSTEISFSIKLQGMTGNGLIAMNVRADQ